MPYPYTTTSISDALSGTTKTNSVEAFARAMGRHYYAAWKRIIAWEGLEKALGLPPNPPPQPPSTEGQD